MRLKFDKIVGTMIGLACGDALGLPFEFMSRDKIYDEYGVVDKMIGGGTWGQPAGMVSDDTEMALAVANGIIECPGNPVPSIGKRFLDWYEGNPFDVGICCSSVIAKMIGKENPTKWDWFDAAREYAETTDRSAGNGGLMRTAFVGAYYKTLRDVELMAYDICGMTHFNEIAQTDCALMSMIIHELINGGTKETIEKMVMGYADCGTRYDLGKIEGYPFMINPNGYCVNSFACALKCVLTTGSFQDAVKMAVNMGGDTDTIGAITGAIAGALYGADGIPKDWILALDKNIVSRIVEVCVDCAVYRLGGEENVVHELCEWSKREVQTRHDNSVGCGYEG